MLAACAAPAWACEYPDQGGMPLRRAVWRVQDLPEARAWATERREDGAIVHYAVLLEKTRIDGGRCYWTVEVSAAGALWRRFYVTPDGKSLLRE